MLEIVLGIATLSIIILCSCWIIFQKEPHANPSKELKLLIQLTEDATRPCIHRLSSNIIQISVYIGLLLATGAAILQKPIPYELILNVIIGAITTLGAAISVLKLTPYFIPKIILNSKLNFKKGCSETIKASHCLGFLCFIPPIILMSCSLLNLTFINITGVLLGIILATFFLRIGSGMINAALYAQSAHHSIDTQLNQNHPISSMSLLCTTLNTIIGYSADLISSFCMILLAFQIMPVMSESTASNILINKLCWYVILMSALSSILGLSFSWLRLKTKIVTNIILETIYLGTIFSGVGIYIVFYYVLNLSALTPFADAYFLAYLIGLIGTFSICFSSEYLTSNRFKPAQRIARESEWGTGMTFINGFALGLKSNLVFLLIITLIIITSIALSDVYGLIFASLGMLSITGNVIIGKTFTSISELLKTVSNSIDSLETERKNFSKIYTIGQTTIALGNGFACACTIVATTSALFAWSHSIPVVSLSIISGILVGLSIPHINSGYLLSGLKHTFITAMNESKRQFKEIPYLVKGKANPDMVTFADRTLKATMDNLIIPGIFTACIPIFTVLLFGKDVALALVLGCLIATFSKGYYWGNVGDVLHHTKDYINLGHFGGTTGKPFEHVNVAATIGSGFKDILGPSMNIFLKSIFMLALGSSLLIQ